MPTSWADSSQFLGTRSADQDSASALVLVDLQNDFCHPDGVFAANGLTIDDAKRAALIAAVNDLCAAARAAGVPVIWVKMVWDGPQTMGLIAKRSAFLAECGLRRGTWGAELLEGISWQPQDWVVEKTRFSAFYKTDLEDRLRDAGIERMVIGGVRTDFCVESTVRDAYFRDFDVRVPVEIVGGYKPDMHEASLKLMNTVFSKVVSAEEAKQWLSGA